MTIPGSHYYVQYKANEKGFVDYFSNDSFDLILLDDETEWKKSYTVSNDRTILINSLQPGTTYTVILIASDGISAETKSDPKMVTTLSKGIFFSILYF